MSTSKQNTLTFFYGKKAAVPLSEPTAVATKPITTTTIAATVATVAATETSTASEDEHIAAFYASLSPNERKAHEIAARSLGTSYDVRRTHGFTRWFSKK